MKYTNLFISTLLISILITSAVSALEPIYPVIIQYEPVDVFGNSEARQYGIFDYDAFLNSLPANSRESTLALSRNWQVGGATCSVNPDYEQSFIAVNWGAGICPSEMSNTCWCYYNRDLPGVSIHGYQYPGATHLGNIDVVKGERKCFDTTLGYNYRFVFYECDTPIGQNSCSDDDGGITYNKAGAIKITEPDGQSSYTRDTCDGNILAERYCDANNEAATSTKDCSKDNLKCVNGACVASSCVRTNVNTCYPTSNWVVEKDSCGNIYQWKQNCDLTSQICKDGFCRTPEVTTPTTPTTTPTTTPGDIIESAYGDIGVCYGCKGDSAVPITPPTTARESTPTLFQLLSRQSGELKPCEEVVIEPSLYGLVNPSLYSVQDIVCKNNAPVVDPDYFKPEIVSVTIEVDTPYGWKYLVVDHPVGEPIPENLTKVIGPKTKLRVTALVSNEKATNVDIDEELAKLKTQPGGQEVIDATFNVGIWDRFKSWIVEVVPGGKAVTRKVIDLSGSRAQEAVAASDKQLIDAAPWIDLAVFEVALYSEEARNKAYSVVRGRQASLKEPWEETIQERDSCQSGESAQGYIQSHAIILSPPINGVCKEAGEGRIGAEANYGGACKVRVRTIIEIPDSTDKLVDSTPNYDPEGAYTLILGVFDQCYISPESTYTKSDVAGWDIQTANSDITCCRVGTDFNKLSYSECLASGGIPDQDEIQCSGSNEVCCTVLFSGNYVVRMDKCIGFESSVNMADCIQDGVKPVCGPDSCELGYVCNPQDGSCVREKCTADTFYECPSGEKITALKCIDGNLEPSGETCAPTCNDRIQNQGEQKVDCGGPCDPCFSWSDKCKYVVCEPGYHCDDGECVVTKDTDMVCCEVGKFGENDFDVVTRAECNKFWEKNWPVDDCNGYEHGEFYLNPDMSSQFCIAFKGEIDTCFARKSPMPLSQIENLEPLSEAQVKASGYLLDSDNPICNVEGGDLMCREGSECLLAYDSDAPNKKDQKLIYDYMKDEVFKYNVGGGQFTQEVLGTLTLPAGVITTGPTVVYKAVNWIDHWATGAKTVDQKFIEQYGLCVYEDRSPQAELTRWFANLFNLDPDAKSTTYYMIGAIVVVLFLVYLLMNTGQRRQF